MKTNLVRCTVASIPLLFASTLHVSAQNRYHSGHDHYWYVERYQECRCFWETDATARRDTGLWNWRASRMQRVSALNMCLQADDAASTASARAALGPALLSSRAKFCDPY